MIELITLLAFVYGIGMLTHKAIYNNTKNGDNIPYFSLSVAWVMSSIFGISFILLCLNDGSASTTIIGIVDISCIILNIISGMFLTILYGVDLSQDIKENLQDEGFVEALETKIDVDINLTSVKEIIEYYKSKGLSDEEIEELNIDYDVDPTKEQK